MYETKGEKRHESFLFLPTKRKEEGEEGKKNFVKRGNGKFASFSRVMRLRKFYRSGRGGGNWFLSAQFFFILFFARNETRERKGVRGWRIIVIRKRCE